MVPVRGAPSIGNGGSISAGVRSIHAPFCWPVRSASRRVAVVASRPIRGDSVGTEHFGRVITTGYVEIDAEAGSACNFAYETPPASILSGDKLVPGTTLAAERGLLDMARSCRGPSLSPGADLDQRIVDLAYLGHIERIDACGLCCCALASLIT